MSMRRFGIISAAALAWGFCPSAFGADQILIDDKFADGDRDSVAPPESVAWVSGGAASDELVAAAGRVSFSLPEDQKSGYGARGLMALLRPDGGPVELGVGGSLTAEVTYRFEKENPDDYGLRLLFLKTGGGVGARDIHGFNDSKIAGWTAIGARAAMGPGSGKRCAIIRRSESGANLLAASGYKNLTPPVRQISEMDADASHRATLRIERTDEKNLLITSEIGGVSLSASEEFDGGFDAVGIFPSRPCGLFTVESFRVVLGEK
jgi:hypothetical protein